MSKIITPNDKQSKVFGAKVRPNGIPKDRPISRDILGHGVVMRRNNCLLCTERFEAPHESLLVLDANTGQNALSQARLFTEVTKVTGLVLAKLDGTAKGGVIVGLADEFGIPLKYVGVGEGIEDLRDFDAGEFVDALFETEA